jgi:Ca-activated chloride channel homolog
VKIAASGSKSNFMKKLWLVLFLIPVIVVLSFLTGTQLSGTIKDDSGNPVGSALITEIHTKESTKTNSAGHFSFVVNHPHPVLMITATGLASQRIAVGSNRKMNIVLNRQNPLPEELILSDAAVVTDAKIAGSLKGKVYGLTSGYMGARNPGNFNTEDYDFIAENRFYKATQDPLSTFSIDVDKASYSNIRRFLNEGELPPNGAVRIEEMINYFHYDYPQPKNDHPFSINTELSDCPWNKDHKLVLIGLQGKKIPVDNLPASNFTFLIDVSGSMMDQNKLPLVKSSLNLLVDQLREQDRISIVVYAGAAGLVLAPTAGFEKTKIREAINDLEAGGSTAGGEGIRLAYKTARKNFIKEGNNRVILCTDGDFNVGPSSDDDLERMIEKERESGVYLTVLGYGMGNYKDNKMQKLADKGNGNHAYIDGISEAKKVLINEFGGTLFTIAKDVKLQVEFNPLSVAGYRLIGYENRLLDKEDFKDDKKDAGELGSGHTVTALYEIIPAGVKSDFLSDVDNLKYQHQAKVSNSKDLLTVKFRYKKPEEATSILLEAVVNNNSKSFSTASENLRFAVAVAEFGMLLTESKFKGSASFSEVLRIAKAAKGNDPEGYRQEFFTMVEKASKMQRKEGGDDSAGR